MSLLCLLSILCFQDLPLEPGGAVLEVGKAAASLPPPLYLGEENVWIDGQGNLVFFLPDPNADGKANNISANLVYEVQLMIGCQTVYSDVFSSASYPALFKPSWIVPSVPYTLDVARIDLAAANKDGENEGAVIVGPLAGSGFTQLPKDPVEIKRWLLHMPKLGGGFEATLVFNNRFPDLPATIYLVGFDQNGVLVPNSQKSVAVVGQRPQTKLYRDNSGKSYLYDTSFVDKISHLGLIELNGNRLVQVSVVYRSTVANALSASVTETDLDKGDSVGREFSLNARESSVFWDGVAVLNLTGKVNVQVTVEQRRRSDDTILATKALGTIGPGQKMLSVLSDSFPFQQDSYYAFTTASAGQQIQILGLKGTLQENPPLMVTSPVVKKK
ncbi:MAG: hypothetical protein KDC71_08940 [Acidobacteria bacterium]|nr:hypothetical protein [Acidobacteriota bacterium]